MKKQFLFVFALLLTQLALAQWEEDVRLTDTFLDSYTIGGNEKNIAVNADTVHIIWQDVLDLTYDIFYKRSTDGGITWENGTNLTNADGESEYPCVAASGPYVHVAWQDFRVNNYDLYYMRSVDGGSNWGPEICLIEDLFSQWCPSLATSGNYVHLVYEDDRSGDYEVYYRNSPDNGATWSDEVRLTKHIGASDYPCVVSYGSDVHVFWEDDRDGNVEIYYIMSIDNGISWGEETRLTDHEGSSGIPSAAVFGSVVHVTWYDERDNNFEIYYKRSEDGGTTWGEDTRLTSNTGFSFTPNIAVSGDHVHIVWEDSRAGISELYYKTSEDGGITWGADTRLTFAPDWSEYPSIALSDSVVHITWCDSRDDNREIYYKRNPTGNLIVGMDEHGNSLKGKFFVYPNPASRQLTVDSWQLTDGQSAVGGRRSAVKLSIVDLYGRQIKEIGDVLTFPYHADISDLPEGVYFLRIMDESCKSGSVKFVKISD